MKADGEVTREEIVYVSWGGTGRAATLRTAMIKAQESGRDLLYLAVLDTSTFGDIDDAMLDLASDELAWLLETQLQLTKAQTGLDDVAVRVVVRTGDVADRIAEVVQIGGTTRTPEVLIGAPVPESAEHAVAELRTALQARLSVPVELIGR